MSPWELLVISKWYLLLLGFFQWDWVWNSGSPTQNIFLTFFGYWRFCRLCWSSIVECKTLGNMFCIIWFDETGNKRKLCAGIWQVPAFMSIASLNFQWSSFRIPYWILYRKSKWQTKIKLRFIIKNTMTFISLRRIVKVTIWHHSTNKNRSYWY